MLITERCNHHCAHCAGAYTAEGRDMSWKVFKAAVDMDVESVVLGGGEPTLHRQFGRFLLYAIAKAEYVWMATNGSQTEMSIMLAKLARKGVLGVALSQDSHHDPIDAEVRQAFQKEPSLHRYGETDNDQREIRCVDGKEIMQGRCDWGEEDACVCSGLIVKPDGRIYMCGCPEAPQVGHVFKGFTDYDSQYDCIKEMLKNGGMEKAV